MSNQIAHHKKTALPGIVPGALFLLAALFMSAHAQAAEIKGFRSAAFGADEKTVEAAIKKDLGKKTGIQRNEEPRLKVTALSVALPEFAPLNQPATVNYILGYKCRCLTKVVIQWTYPDKIEAAQRAVALDAIARLTRHFQEMNLDKVITNRALGEQVADQDIALIFYRGEDKQGRTVALIGGPVRLSKQGDGMTADVDKLSSLSLVYERDPAKPDEYHIDLSGF